MVDNTIFALFIIGGGKIGITGVIVNRQYPQKSPEYLDNLHRLGIVEVYFDRFLANNDFYEKLKFHPQFPYVEGYISDRII